jgi:hypothetical protein
VKEKQQPPVPERLRLAFSGSVRFSERVAAVRAIHTSLTAAERDALYRYLRTPANNPPDRDRENWLRNEFMDKLVQQADVPPGLADLLVAVHQDTTQDPVMRDYAVQQMPPIYDRVSSESQATLNETMWQATEETGSSIAGTALLALLEVAGPRPSSGDVVGAPPAAVASAVPADDYARLAQAALRLASNDRCGELARITAVSVCGRMQVEQALPVVEQLAQTAPSMPLRIAATAALGDLGDPAATETLTNLVNSSDQRQAFAAQSALNRLATRSGYSTTIANSVQHKGAL